jgi:hypothetical protein
MVDYDSNQEDNYNREHDQAKPIEKRTSKNRGQGSVELQMGEGLGGLNFHP